VKRLVNLLLAGIALLAAGGGFAAPPTEYQLKAAFLLNFARYVEWPAAKAAPGSPIRICVLGRDPFGTALAAVDGRQAQGRDVRVRVLDAADSATDCHVVFIAESEEKRVPLLLRNLAGKGVLTVSDIDGFAEAGGAVGLVNEDDRVRFDINVGTLQRENLKASAQLLRLGRTLVGHKPP
jgi:hypothetical protein